MEYKSELATRLEQIEELTLTTTYLGLDEKDGFFHYSWIVVLDMNDVVFDTKYTTGSGLHKRPDWIVAERNGYYNKTTGGFKTVKEAHKARWITPLTPTMADVVHCLLVDSSCAGGTFEDYCSEFGLNTDSRKTLDTYLECQKTRSTLIKMFGQELFDELSRLDH